MQIKSNTPEEYVDQLPEDRKEAINKLRCVIKENLAKGFEEVVAYGMLGYVVPHSIYPKGYHCDPKVPLSYMNLASQKNFIAVYSMPLYGSPQLLEWFTSEYSKFTKSKLDMGKSCIRFKMLNDIPYNLIGELSAKITVEEWIDLCDTNWVRSKK